MAEEKNIREEKTESKGLEYDDFRDQIKDGDILLYKGQGFVSRVIQFFTRSEYSHAGIVVRWNKRLMVMEAIRKGVIVNPFRRSVNRYKGTVEWWSSKQEINDATRERMIRFAQRQLGKDFGFWLLFWFAFMISFFYRDLDKRDAVRRERKLFCSLYVALIYHEADIDLAKNRADRFTSPADIASSPKLVKRMPLKKTLRSKLPETSEITEKEWAWARSNWQKSTDTYCPQHANLQA